MKNRSSFINFKLFALLLILFLAFPLMSKGADADLYLSPSSGSFLTGSTFTVSVFLNTGGNEINTVWADLEFPPELLQITSPTAGTSFIKEWITPPNYSNEKGIISFRGGIPGGISASAGLISSVTFRAVASGNAKIRFSEQSKILLNDGMGTDILRNKINGEFQILVPSPEGPITFSPTHPDPDTWYSDSSPSFSWEKEDNITGYSWSFSQNSQERPEGVIKGSETAVSFDQIEDGIWYFHIRQQKNGIWGKTSHVQVRIDTSSPREFVPRVVTYSKLIGYQTMVYFETQDDFSGIGHYETSIIDLNGSDPVRSFFTEQISPYKIPNTKAGKYNVIIKAVDRAGNIKEGEVRFRLMTPLVTNIEGKGLEIKGFLCPWWLIAVLIVILALILFRLVWILIKKTTGNKNGQ